MINCVSFLPSQMEFCYIPETVVHCLGRHHIIFSNDPTVFHAFLLVSTCACKTDPCSEAALLEHLRRSKSTSQPPDFVPCPEVLSFFRELEEEMERYIRIYHVRHAAWYVNIVYT